MLLHYNCILTSLLTSSSSSSSFYIPFLEFTGGRYAGQYMKKSRKGAVCGDCKISLPGIKHMSNPEFKNCKKREKTVARAYGGSRCANCVRQRIVRAFLVEEQKIVKKVLAEKGRKSK